MDSLLLTDLFRGLGLRLQGFKSKSVETSVGRVHVLDGRGAGPLPPVVVLHGFSAAAVQYGALLRRLQRISRRVIAPDLPGHGQSDIPREGLSGSTLLAGLREVLDHVLDEPAVVFGSSMGGLGAVRYARARPERLRGLVLCSPLGAPMSPAEMESFRQRFRLRDHESALAFIDSLFHKPPRIRQLMAWGVRVQFARPHLQALLEAVTPSDLLAADDLRGLEVPTLLVWGLADRLLPRHHCDFFADALPKTARVERPEHFGHCPFLDVPGELTEHIGAFARGLP